MKQVEHLTYTTTNAERVTIEIVPVKVGGLVRAAQNGVVLANEGTDAKPSFSFEISSNLHLLRVLYHFPKGTDNNAHYDVFVESSSGDRFQDRTISNRGDSSTAVDRKVNYEFEME